MIGARELAAEAIAGIDVGEDYLDLAVIDRRPARLAYRRVALAGIGVDALGALGERIAAAAPELVRGPALAIVDSPRLPRDRALPGWRVRAAGRRGRALDLALRRMTAMLAAGAPAIGRLSMYPTPPAAYFRGCIADPACKPHLQALGAALFGPPRRREQRRAAQRELAPRGGALFTRFMIAGFAAYRALEAAGIEACESFPDLQFRLAAPGTRLAPKRAGAQALAMRRRIVARLAAGAGIEAARPPTLDLADAAVLALAALNAARTESLVELRSEAEGGFVLGLNPAQANSCGLQVARLTGGGRGGFKREIGDDPAGIASPPISEAG